MALVMGAFLIAHNIDLWISFHSSSLNRSIPSINPFDSFLIIKIAMLISVQPTATDDARTRAGPFMIAAYPKTTSSSLGTRFRQLPIAPYSIIRKPSKSNRRLALSVTPLNGKQLFKGLPGAVRP